jgi:1,4-dihydroxy-2-naphthoate octaprenyltransferase
VKSLKIWLKTLRAPFFQAVVIPLLLGTAMAWHNTGMFDIFYFLLALVGVVCAHAGANLANDYFDHRSGDDEINKQYTAFSGGSRTIQDGQVSPAAVLRVSLACFAVAAAIGILLSFILSRGWILLIIGFLGIASGFFYTASPVRAAYRGWGELLVGFSCGPVVVTGAYYVQAQSLGLDVFIASIPIGFLIAAILYVNQFPDYEADKAVNKINLVVKYGPEASVRGFYMLLGGTYVIIVAGCAMGMFPWPAGVAVLSIPIAWRAAHAAGQHHASGSGKKLVPAMAGTIATHLVTGLLMAGGYVAAGVWQ